MYILTYKIRMGNFTGFQKSEDYYIHPRLGQIKRIQKQDGPQLIQHKVLVQSEDVFDHWAKSVEKLEASPCQGIIFLPKSHYFQRVGYCGHNGQVFLLFDDYMFSLKDEIKNRRLIGRHFPETSVWEILYKLIKVQNYLQKNDFALGNVNSQNIIVNQEGDLRVVCQYSFPVANANSFDLDEKSRKLYSPEEWAQFLKISSLTHKEEIENIKQNAQNESQNFVQDKYNKNLAQIFSIGAMLLQICTLQESEQIYNKKGIDETLIWSRINLVNKQYSNVLANIIRQMLRLNPIERIKAQEIQNLLSPQQQAILNHKPFDLKHRFDSGILNISAETAESVLERKHAKEDKKRWERFTNFFPFLRKVSQTQENLINSLPTRRNSVTDKLCVRVATVH